MPMTGAPEGDRNAAPAPQAQTPAKDGGQDFSTTNVQEAGVDEPDLVKTDGKTLFVVANGKLVAVDARSAETRVLDTLDLGGYGQELLLFEDRLLVLSGAGFYGDVIIGPTPVRPGVGMASIVAPYVGGKSVLQEVDVSDPAKLRIVKTLEVDGSYVSARLTGRSARVVFTSPPRAIYDVQPVAETVDRRAAIRRTTTPKWRPSYISRRGTKGKAKRRALVACRSIRRPDEFSGLNSLTVLTIDMSKGIDPVDSDAILTDGRLVYGSTESLYVATEKLIAEQPTAGDPPKGMQTEIHKFDASKPGETTYRASGVVTGSLLNQFSLSEEKGFLRVASTDSPLWWSPGQNRPESESFVTVLAERGDALAQVGRVGGLGKGERIYAVRFIGDKGYVVTFRQVDPLFVLGLSDPENPRVLGQLDLLGYSAYLHPVGPDLLLGVGQAADEQGRTQGTQLSLFDVSDPAKPSRIAQHAVGSSSNSDVEYDHHAFLWWGPSALAVMPVQIWGRDKGGQEFAGAIGFKVSRGGIDEAGRASHPATDGYAPPVQRSLVVGDRLFTVSGAGVKATDLGTFADRGFAAFPQPEPQPAQPQSSPPSR
jgi:uncharacterized secreted protein with C-terminal beta-propeller domain